MDDKKYHSEDEPYHFGIKGIRRGVKRFMAKQYDIRNAKKDLRKTIRKMNKEHRKGNGKEVFNENYRNLKYIRKMINDKSTVKYLSKFRGKDLGKLTLSDKMYKKASKKYRKNSLKAIKSARKETLKNISHSDKTETLYHFGIRGMRWGIRRRLQNSLNRSMSKSKGQGNGESYLTKKAKHTARHMTEADLKSKISRLKLEKEYNTLVKEARPNAMRKLADITVGYTKDGKAKKLGPVLADHIINNYLDKAIKLGYEQGAKALLSAKTKKKFHLRRSS